MPRDDTDETILSDPEPIASDDDGAGMSLDEAVERSRRLAGDFLEDVGAPFRDEVLDIAARLKLEKPDEYARLTSDVKASDADTNDWKGQVKDRARELIRKKRDQRDARPTIVDGSDLHVTVEEACNALADLGGIYERGGELVEVIEGDDEDDVRPNPVQKGRIRELLSRAARWERETADGAKPIKPPVAVADSVHSRASWGLPKLRGFVDGAAVLEDGQILSTEGYHPQEGLYVRRSEEIAGLRSPDQDDAVEAREHLTELLCDFELVEENREAHESSWLASLLTILARHAIDGSTPLHLFDANRPRVGKTRLAEMAALIATGRSPDPQPAPSGRDADSEMRKTITGIARKGSPIVFFDNVKGKLGGPSLELAITAKRWSARILGQSRTYEGKLRVTWMATSNNCQLTPDMHGRTLLTRIKSSHEAPEQRTGFKFPRIMRHVREHREEYLKDALTILRAWFVEGRPTYELTPWGSFEEWGRLIRNAIVHAGGADPCEARQGLIDADSETRAAKSVFENWPAGEGYTSSEIAKAMKSGDFGGFSMDDSGDLVESLKEFLTSRSPRGIGYQMGSWKDRRIGDRVLVAVKDTARNLRVWKVKEVDE